MNFTAISIIFKASNLFCIVIITTVIWWFNAQSLTLSSLSFLGSQEQHIFSSLMALFIIFLKNKIVVIKESIFLKEKRGAAATILEKDFEGKPLLCFFFFTEKKLFPLVKRYHCRTVVIGFVARKEHHKRNINGK